MAEQYLEHFGVPGMKWGHRKARAQMTAQGKKSDNTNLTKAYIKKSGSVNKAVARTGGSYLLKQAAIAAGTIAISGLAHNKSVTNGALMAAKVLTVVNAADTTMKMRRIGAAA